MSSALVRQSLALVDPDFEKTNGKQKLKKTKKVKDLIPENQKIYRKLNHKGKQVDKVNMLETKHKLTVLEAKATSKSKEDILQANLEKLQRINEICKIHLDKTVTKHIIDRAVTRRPIKRLEKKKKSQKTVFTDDDFKKFEEEYLNDDT